MTYSVLKVPLNPNQPTNQPTNTMDRSHLNQKHMKNANRLQEFDHKRCSKCPPFARTHAWRHFFTGPLQSQ